MVVFLEEFTQIKPWESFGQAVGAGDLAMQQGRPDHIAFRLGKAELRSHVLVMVFGMIQPLLSMGHAMAALIHNDRCVVWEVVEQRGRFAPGQAHQSAHALGTSALQELFRRLVSQESIEAIGHRFAQRIGDQRTESGRRQAKLVDRVK